MTVCIASCSTKDNCIFFASDTMVSTGDMSADMAAFKFRAIGNNWLTLYAGNDISVITPMIRHVTDRVQLLPDTLENIQMAFIEAFHLQLEKKAENEVLRPLGYSLKEFKQEGLLRLGADNFSRLMMEIQQQTIDVQFLVAGFDRQQPYVFTVSSPGRISDYTEIGFWAIGSGQTNALGSIFNSGGQLRFDDLETHLYRMLEAKFNAETAVGVGKHTVVTILESGSFRYSMVIPEQTPMRGIWDKTRVKKIPQGGREQAAEMLKKAKSDAKKRLKKNARKAQAKIQAAGKNNRE